MSFKRFSHLGAGWCVEPEIDDMRGFNVFDSAGKFIGIVDDLLVDAEDHESIDYALIGQGNIAVMLNGKEAIAPVSKLGVDTDNKVVRLDVTLDQLWDFPAYDTLEDADLKDAIDSFWASVAVRPVPHDVTVPHPTSLESPPPIPPEVAPSKLPAGKPMVVAGLESPVPQEVVDRALQKVARKEAAAREKPALRAIRPELEEEKREKPAA